MTRAAITKITSVVWSITIPDGASSPSPGGPIEIRGPLPRLPASTGTARTATKQQISFEID
jgi:hypothetical protein